MTISNMNYFFNKSYYDFLKNIAIDDKEEKIIENDKLSQKIASMEKQLKKIEKNLAVITEYIDEEDAQDDEFYSDEPVN